MRKGEWAVGFSDQGLGHGTYGVVVKATNKVVVEDISKDEAEDIVLRWNAFEEGGLVEELRTVLKDVLKRIEDSEEWWIDCPDKGGFDTEKLEAALAKS